MSVNKVILVGRLGRDPEVRYMPNGEAVANFGVATSESWKDRNGQKQERTEWHNVTLYRKLAEIAGQYLKKGSQVYIEGSIRSRKYTGKDGIERTAYEIIGSEMKMLGSRADSMGSGAMGMDQDDYASQAPETSSYGSGYGSSNSNSYGSGNTYNNQSSASGMAAPESKPTPPRREVNQPAAFVEDLGDDIPF